MSLAPVPVSPDVSVGQNSFAEWAAQGPTEAEKTRAVYASFASAEDETVRIFLRKVDQIKYGGEINLGICLKIR